MKASMKQKFDVGRKMFETKNSLDEKTRIKVGEILNRHLADLSDLYSQTKHAHWNVRGPLFISLHKLFDELAEAVEEHIDPLAERITALGGTAFGTVRLAAQNSSLEEFPVEGHDDIDFVPVLIERFGNCTNALRKSVDETDDLGDAMTTDLLTEICRDLDKALWFLEAHRRE